MIRLEGTYDTPTVVTLIPSPVVEDTQGLEDQINFGQSMDGTRYTYVKSTNDKRLSYTFQNIGRGKILEIQEFFRTFRGEFIRLINFRGETWKVFVDADSINFQTDKRSVNSGGSRKEAGSFTLEFVGELQ